MCVSCGFSKLRGRINQASINRQAAHKKANSLKEEPEECARTLSELKELAAKYPKNAYIKSAINLYSLNCNAFKNSIDDSISKHS